MLGCVGQAVCSMLESARGLRIASLRCLLGL